MHLNSLKEESSSCQCSMTLNGMMTGKKKYVLLIGHWTLLGPGSEKKWNGTDAYQPNGAWDRIAEIMMVNFSESGHPISRATVALERGILKSKGGGQKSMHFCGDFDTVRVLFHTIVCSNRLSIYGAIADLCEEYCLYQPGNPLISTGQPFTMETHRAGCTCRIVEYFKTNYDR